MGELYEIFPTARFISGLLSDDLATGFAVGNALFVAFGLWCYAMPVRGGWPSARGLAWFWVIVELGNGVLHATLAISRGGYYPGVATAPVLLGLALWLGVLLTKTRDQRLGVGG